MLHIRGTAVLDTLEAIRARAGKEELARILKPTSRKLQGETNKS